MSKAIVDLPSFEQGGRVAAALERIADVQEGKTNGLTTLEQQIAVAYAANDVILIILWILASFSDMRYISVAVCFVAFLFNDIYGFISWKKMKKRQAKASG